MVRRWVQAWTRGDIGGVRGLLADDVHVRDNLHEGRPTDLIGSVERLAAGLRAVTIMSEAVTPGRAALVYDCVPHDPRGTVRLAEFLDIADGRITNVRRVYDLVAVDALLPDLRD